MQPKSIPPEQGKRMKVCGPMAGALSGRSRVRKPCRTRQRAGPQSRLLTYLGHKEASCVSPGVERLINRLKQFRRIATRYEKRAANYLAMLTIGMILLWI